MKLPSCTARTRSAAGLKVMVSDSPERRDAFVAETATVYGPPPTRNSGPGGVITISAPALASTGFAFVAAGGAPGAGACGVAAPGTVGAGAAATAVVPGIGELPGGMIDTLGAPAAGPWPAGFGA